VFLQGIRHFSDSLGAVRETQTFKTKHYILLYRCNMAEILLKWRKTKIDQSIRLDNISFGQQVKVLPYLPKGQVMYIYNVKLVYPCISTKLSDKSG
jgi:hypothetical protein